MKKPPSEHLRDAIRRAGGQKALAAFITTEILPVGQSHISMWLNRESVPADYCPAIERTTGVRCEDLNPKVDWAYLREAAGNGGV